MNRMIISILSLIDNDDDNSDDASWGSNASFSEPIIERSKAKPTQSQITFDIQLKIAPFQDPQFSFQIELKNPFIVSVAVSWWTLKAAV